MRTIDDQMAEIATDGWCVVLKKLPPGFPWIFDDEPKSEYDAGDGRQHEVGRDQWVCEAQDVRPEGRFRHSEFATADTALGAIEKVREKLTKGPPPMPEDITAAAERNQTKGTNAMKTKHTPGPWEVQKEPQIVSGMAFIGIETADKTIHQGEYACPVALAYDIDRTAYPHLGDSEANARLIASAPALLAACKGLMADDYHAAVEQIWDGPGGTTDCAQAHKLIHERNSAARLAIAAAEGETT